MNKKHRCLDDWCEDCKHGDKPLLDSPCGNCRFDDSYPEVQPKLFTPKDGECDNDT